MGMYQKRKDGNSRITIQLIQHYQYILSDYIVFQMLHLHKRTVKEAISSQKPSLTIKIIDSRYEVKNIYLGQGAFGQVYVCWDKINYQVLAVKAISKAKIMDKINKSESKQKAKQFYIKSLREQALLMEKLDHPNIVRFNGYSQNNSQLYYFLQYCNEGTVQNLIKKEGKLPIRIAIPLMKEILSAVIYLHQNSICHRDIKPQNILLQNGSAKLGDFGFAIKISKDDDNQNFLVGTEDYMAPQLIVDKRFSLKSDIWSLGVTFFRMICGQNPWTFSRDEKIWVNRIKNLPTISCAQAPLWLKSVITKMLTFEQNFRPSALDLEHFFQF